MTGDSRILLAHGGGGQLTFQLIEQVILPALGTQEPGSLDDAATLDAPGSALAFTTDSYVVSPLEFPGGDIGKLAVCGTINDLAVSGARPIALSMGLVIEEGFEIARLARLLASAGRTAGEAGVRIVTGDTKVVERGKCDGLYVNTSGVGARLPGANLGCSRIEPGDVVLLSGPIAEHGLAIMSLREGLTFASTLTSDCAPLHRPCAALVETLGGSLKFMRDLTRGGLAGTLAEVSSSASCDVEIVEDDIPVTAPVRAAAEILGLDALGVANEGKFAAVVEPDAAAKALDVMRRFDLCRHASRIGTVREAGTEPLVEMVTVHGGRRIVQMPYGEELPRIC